MEENTYYDEEGIDVLSILMEQEDRREKAQLLREKHKIGQAKINEKYKDLIIEHSLEAKMVEDIVSEFNAKWGPRFADYDHESKALKKKYRKLIKNL